MTNHITALGSALAKKAGAAVKGVVAKRKEAQKNWERGRGKGNYYGSVNDFN